MLAWEVPGEHCCGISGSSLQSEVPILALNEDIRTDDLSVLSLQLCAYFFIQDVIKVFGRARLRLFHQVDVFQLKFAFQLCDALRVSSWPTKCTRKVSRVLLGIWNLGISFKQLFLHFKKVAEFFLLDTVNQGNVDPCKLLLYNLNKLLNLICSLVVVLPVCVDDLMSFEENLFDHICFVVV